MATTPDSLSRETAIELLDKAFSNLVYPLPRNSREEAYNEGLSDLRDDAIREFRFGL